MGCDGDEERRRRPRGDLCRVSWLRRLGLGDDAAGMAAVAVPLVACRLGKPGTAAHRLVRKIVMPLNETAKLEGSEYKVINTVKSPRIRK